MDIKTLEKSFDWLQKPLIRREFLKVQIRSLFCISMGLSGLVTPRSSKAGSTPDIVHVKGSPGAAARAAVGLLGGIRAFVKPGDRVLIKPNMSFPNPPEMGTTTSPEIIREISTMCIEAGASKVLIIDYPLSEPEDCLNRSGIRDICKDLDRVSVAAATSSRLYQETEFPNAKLMPKNSVLKEALKSDVLIAVPVAKSHSSTGVSLSMKGMMGLVWNRGGMHSRGLSECIVDLCSVLKADLTLIDGTKVLSTRGPRGPGEVLKKDIVIASRDMVAADAYAVSLFEWYGKKYKPQQVQHLLLAHKGGLGNIDLENLDIKGMVL